MSRVFEQALDRDSPAGRRAWYMTLLAVVDGGDGQVAQTDITVHLIDINDNRPIFPQVS